MATNSSDPIVIGSDDESDNDDVVLIKEEIEVDSEDVIFLSETKATPKTDKSTTDKEIKSCDSKSTLPSNQSLPSIAGQLSLDDTNDTDILDDILANTPPTTSGPLDLSSKSSVSDSDVTNQSDTYGTDGSMITNSGGAPNPDSSFMTLLADAMPLLQASSGLRPDSLVKSPSQNVVKGHFSSTSDMDTGQDGGCSLDSDTTASSDNTKALAIPICDKSKTNDGSMMTDSDWFTLNLLSSGRTTSANQDEDNNSKDPLMTNSNTAIGCNVNSISNKNDSVIANSEHKVLGSMSTTGSVFPKSEQTIDQSVVMKNANQSESSAILPATCQSSNNTSSSDLNAKSFHVDSINSQTVDTSNGQPDAVATLNAQNSQPVVAMDTSKHNSSDVSDPFQTSHALLASLNVDKPKSIAGSTIQSQSTVNSDAQSNCPMQDVQSVSQAASFTSGLLGGSTQCIQPSLSYQSSDISKSTNAALASGIIKRTVSMLESDTPYYNALTLRLSQHDKTFRRSLSTGAFSTQNKASYNSTDFSSQSTSTIPRQTQRLDLPPKKQRRCYSDAVRDSNCISCESNLMGQKASQCPNGHTTCTKCLEERVKLVLTGRAKESVKCLNQSCNSYYPISELRQSLPAMVVEILEDKLDQDYVNYISDMIMKQASEEIDEENASDDLDQTDEGRFLKKYEDCPGHWDPMDEREVNRDGYVLVPLETESPDYQNVVLRFFDSMVDHNVEVTSVCRVQNPIQWKYYSVKKSEMFRDSGGFYSVVEDQLFHGTTSSSVEAICRKGFDWRLCGKHGTLYGQGSYFAVNASYSHQYTDLRRQHGTLRSSMTFATAPTISFTGIPPYVNISPSLHPTSVGISVIHGTQYTPMNLSHNAPLNQPMGASSSQTGLQRQTLSGSQISNNSNQSISQNSNNSSQSTSQISNNNNQSGSQQTGVTTSASSADPAQPGPSGVSGSSSSSTFMQSIRGLHSSDVHKHRRHVLHTRKKHHFCMQRLLPKPAALKNPSTQSANSQGVNFDCQPEVEKVKAKVFFARVLVGKYTAGNPKLRKPPPLYASGDKYGKCYDSCVDNENNPKIFVVFDTAQAYPEYLVEYTYVNEKMF